MKKKLQRRFGLKRETLRTLTESVSSRAVGGTIGTTNVVDWTENPGGISCIYPGGCGTGYETITDPGCGASCELEPC